MKLDALIKSLQEIQAHDGNIEVQVQNDPSDSQITSHESFFIVPEKYDDGWRVNIRTWPY